MDGHAYKVAGELLPAICRRQCKGLSGRSKHPVPHGALQCWEHLQHESQQVSHWGQPSSTCCKDLPGMHLALSGRQWP